MLHNQPDFNSSWATANDNLELSTADRESLSGKVHHVEQTLDFFLSLTREASRLHA
jgi:hypothetical protein